ncbi:hypothetical protein GJR88_03465 [Dietzia sp. DQ12-45-1b]|nr:hypothetical protein GJR88_03465 [Dietzia sp. DQ12-45-1b]
MGPTSTVHSTGMPDHRRAHARSDGSIDPGTSHRGTFGPIGGSGTGTTMTA